MGAIRNRRFSAAHNQALKESGGVKFGQSKYQPILKGKMIDVTEEFGDDNRKRTVKREVFGKPDYRAGYGGRESYNLWLEEKRKKEAPFLEQEKETLRLRESVAAKKAEIAANEKKQAATSEKERQKRIKSTRARRAGTRGRRSLLASNSELGQTGKLG